MAIRSLLALAALCGLVGAAQASPVLTVGDPAPPITAWKAFCAKNPAECRVDQSEAEVVAETPELLDLLDAVNAHVNRTITPVTDKDRWGVVDRWDYPIDGQGDCEDIQLLKRRYLAEAGIPRRAMPITVVIDEAGEGHAVLTIRTDKSDLILDNKTYAVKRWDETSYAFVKREAETPTGWGFVEELPDAPVVTAKGP